jgi:hypothetical protein
VLFIVHCSHVEDVIIYVPSMTSASASASASASGHSNSNGNHLLSCRQIAEFSTDNENDIMGRTNNNYHNGGVDSSSLTPNQGQNQNQIQIHGMAGVGIGGIGRHNLIQKEIHINSYNYMFVYGPKLIPNHDRDYPHVTEMVEPTVFLYGSYDSFGGGSGDSGGLGPLSNSGSGSDSGKPIGSLLGAIQLPFVPDVIIDIWKSSSSASASAGDGDGNIWATATINGISFCVLERIYIISESKWGVSKIVQVDIFGRHPSKGYMVVESITA